MADYGPKFNEYVKKNTNYREVISTTHNQQLVVMCIPNNTSIGMEKHPKTTQFFHIVQGKGLAEVGNYTYELNVGDILVVPPGEYHNVTSKSPKGLKLFTIYSPPEHPHNLIQKHHE